jgi:predicted GH43/DUF377 family glycosyl hydrolase
MKGVKKILARASFGRALLLAAVLAIGIGASPFRLHCVDGTARVEGGRVYGAQLTGLEASDSQQQAIDSLIARIAPRGAGEVADLELKPFKKRVDPIMKPRETGFDSRNVYNMATIRENGITTMIYRGEDAGEPAGQCTGRLGIAQSTDGVHFTREDRPVIFPEHDYEKRGIEDPRLVKVEGTYYLTYTAYDGDKARLCLATSEDLRCWKKHGLLFPSFPPTDNWTKSGAILPERLASGDHGGSYVMYFGDTNIWQAFSRNLVHWTPLPSPVIAPRPGRFDNDLVEPGPPPVLTKHGILLIYNSRDMEGGNRAYNVGAALFDRNDPGRMIARTEKPILSPNFDWERRGYVDNVVFAESLTVQNGAVYLYYGGADRCIGLAVAAP